MAIRDCHPETEWCSIGSGEDDWQQAPQNILQGPFSFRNGFVEADNLVMRGSFDLPFSQNATILKSITE